MSEIEIIATVFGVLCVWLTVRQHIGCWPTGLIQVFLYIFIFYRERLYADMTLHIIYVFLSIYGWYQWSQKKSEQNTLKVSIVGYSIYYWGMACLGGTLLVGYSLNSFTDASFPYADSFIMVASLIAQWLMTRKKLESWWFWIFVDIIAIVVYLLKGLYMTTGLYVLFLFLAISGLMVWKKSMVHEKIIYS